MKRNIIVNDIFTRIKVLGQLHAQAKTFCFSKKRMQQLFSFHSTHTLHLESYVNMKLLLQLITHLRFQTQPKMFPIFSKY